METAWNVLSDTWAVLGQMAPYLLFGFLMAGILSVFISPEWVERHLGGRGFGPILKAAVFGVPLPLCSCSVIPVSASMRRHGASRGATTSFLLATPQTGVDSLFATYAFLGPVFTLFRVVVAFLTGLVGGAAVSVFAHDTPEERAAVEHDGCDDDCCGHDDGPACTEACCAGGPEGAGPVRRALHYGFVTLPRDLAKALLVGVLVAGLITALVPQNALAAYVGGGLVAMLVMMAVGIPMYVCATASIPIAVGFIHAGASHGAALAFLIAGPATNAATLSVIWKVMGRRTALIYLSTVAVGAVAAGLGLDAILHGELLGSTDHAHGMESAPWVGHVGAVALLAVIGASMYARGRVHFEKKGAHVGGASELALRVAGMTCEHCAQAIARALSEAPGVSEVDVDLESGRALVHGENLSGDALVMAVAALGYEATPAND